MPTTKNKFVHFYFLVAVLIGIFLYKDFGISWDEPISRNNGAVSVKYALEKFAPGLLFKDAHFIPNLKEYKDRDYGVAFEAPIFIIEKSLGLTQAKDIYQFRHIATYLTFVFGVLALYLLATRRFSDWRIGLLAATFLMCSPRFFAEGFYNSKDIVFMSTFIIATNTMISFIKVLSPQKLIIHSLASAIAIDVRIMGILLVFATMSILMIQLIKREINFRKYITQSTLYLIFTSAFVVVMFPWLWDAPITNFIQALKNMSAFRWGGDVMYMGNYVNATQLPWHYSLVWIAITTPILYLILFIFGSFRIMINITKANSRIWANSDQMQDVIFFGLFWSPICAVIILHSVLYDGWRQLYFIYPFFILIAIDGFVFIRNLFANKKYFLWMLYFILSLSLVLTARWMYKNHPYQNVYFNNLVNKPIRGKFELDYWGLSNRRALEYILLHDASPKINVAAGSWMHLEGAGFMLSAKDRERIHFVSSDVNPHYLITNYRGVIDTDDRKLLIDHELVHQIKVDKEPILSIYKSKN